uniref:CSON000271 protein n=1 Tax=Culicoides sonorensis TaxID=179676 RepID=A0A336MEI7_CULSO
MSIQYYSNPKGTKPGLVFIFSYTRYFKQTLIREGSSIDRDILKNLFRALGFQKNEIHVKEDLPQRDLFICLNNIIRFHGYEKYRSLWIFILTHGRENDFLYAADAPFHISKLKLILTSDTKWMGIPKFLIIQACRGYETDEGLKVTGDICDNTSDTEEATSVPYNIPTTSDTIFFHSTWHGFTSYRTSGGSPFIRFFVENMRKYFYTDDIIKIFTKICRDVAHNFSASAQNRPNFIQLKQMPCFEHSFLYKLHFGRDLENKRNQCELDRYKMDHKNRGLALFIYQKDYTHHDKMCNRDADGDVDRLSALLEEFAYKTQIEIDKTDVELKEILKNVSKYDFLDHDSLIVIFSGHGLNEKVFLKEGFMYTNEFWDPFTTFNGNSLIGKPKLFFISACRGTMYDKGSFGEFRLPDDSIECINESEVVTKFESDLKKPLMLPTKADILAVFSSAEDYISILDKTQKGTFFLIALHEVLKQIVDEENIMDVLLRLNENLGKMITKDLSANKQMSFVLSSLTKELYLSKKKK